MAQWKKDITKFSVKLDYNERRGCFAVIPKPVLEELDNPKRIEFEIRKKGKITIEGSNSK